MQVLMESAASMLKNGATPAVVDVAVEVLGEVGGAVIQAVINESENNQRFIYSLQSRFLVILEVLQLNAEEQSLSGQHKTCCDVDAAPLFWIHVVPVWCCC